MKMSSLFIAVAGLGALAYLYSQHERDQREELLRTLKEQNHEIGELKQQMTKEQEQQQARQAALLKERESEQKKSLTDSRKKLAQLRQELQQRKDEAEDIQVALQGAPSGRSEKDNLNDTVEDIRAEKAVIANLQNGLKKLDAERQRATNAEHGMLNRDKSTYQQLAYDLNEQIKLHQDMVVGYRKDIAAMKSRLGDPVIREQTILVQAKVNEETKTIQLLKEKLATLKYQWDEARALSSAASRGTAGSKRQYDDLKHQLATEEAKLAELTQQQKAQNKEYTAEASHFDKLRADLKQKQEAILSLQKEIAAMEKLASPQP